MPSDSKFGRRGPIKIATHASARFAKMPAVASGRGQDASDISRRQDSGKRQDASASATSSSNPPRRRPAKAKRTEIMRPQPYHVLDVAGDQGGGIFLIEGHVPVQSLARMGLVLPVPWVPIPIREEGTGTSILEHSNIGNGKQESSAPSKVAKFAND